MRRFKVFFKISNFVLKTMLVGNRSESELQKLKENEESF